MMPAQLQPALTHAVVAASLLLSACATDGTTSGSRWLSAPYDTIEVAGASYRVAWLQAAGGEYDFQATRTTFFPDPISEDINTLEAIRKAAAIRCGKRAVEVTKNFDRLYNLQTARFRCG